MESGGEMMKKEKKIKEEKLKIQPIPAFVFKVEGELTEAKNDKQ